MNDSYLQHHGIKGMKWGVRRFRNEDGTLTDAGKKRYSYGGKNNQSPPEKAVSGAKNIVSGMKQITGVANNQSRNRYNKRPNLTQEEMDKMSDKDLRDLVNRLNLEQQYSQLTQDNVARSAMQTGLDYAEAVLTIAGGALSIAAAYKVLKG